MGEGKAREVNLSKYMQAVASMAGAWDENGIAGRTECSSDIMSKLALLDIGNSVTFYQGTPNDGEVFMKYTTSKENGSVQGVLRFSSDGYIYEGMLGKNIVYDGDLYCADYVALFVGGIYGASEIEQSTEMSRHNLAYANALYSMQCYSGAATCTQANVEHSINKINAEFDAIAEKEKATEEDRIRKNDELELQRREDLLIKPFDERRKLAFARAKLIINLVEKYEGRITYKEPRPQIMGTEEEPFQTKVVSADSLRKIYNEYAALENKETKSAKLAEEYSLQAEAMLKAIILDPNALRVLRDYGEEIGVEFIILENECKASERGYDGESEYVYFGDFYDFHVRTRNISSGGCFPIKEEPKSKPEPKWPIREHDHVPGER